MIITSQSLHIIKGNPNHQILNRRIYEEKQKKELKYSIKHSKHSLKRASQRSIRNESILNVLDFGISFHRQGLVFYTIKETALSLKLDHKMKEKIKNLIVVMNGNETQIITCYRAKNAIKHLRQKRKELLK